MILFFRKPHFWMPLWEHRLDDKESYNCFPIPLLFASTHYTITKSLRFMHELIDKIEWSFLLSTIFKKEGSNNLDAVHLIFSLVIRYDFFHKIIQLELFTFLIFSLCSLIDGNVWRLGSLVVPDGVHLRLQPWLRCHDLHHRIRDPAPARQGARHEVRGAKVRKVIRYPF